MHVEGDNPGIFSKAVLEHTLLRSTALGCKIRCVAAHQIILFFILLIISSLTAYSHLLQMYLQDA